MYNIQNGHDNQPLGASGDKMENNMSEKTDY